MENEVLAVMRDYANKTDVINKRLTTLAAILGIILGVCIVAFCIRDAVITHDYFTESPSYSTISNSSGDNSNQSNKVVNGVETYGENSNTN